MLIQKSRRVATIAAAAAIAVVGALSVAAPASAQSLGTGQITRSGASSLTFSVSGAPDGPCTAEVVPMYQTLVDGVNHLRSVIPLSNGQGQTTIENPPANTYLAQIICTPTGGPMWAPAALIVDIGTPPPPSGIPEGVATIADTGAATLLFTLVSVDPGATCIARYIPVGLAFDNNNFGYADLSLVARVGVYTTPALPLAKYVGIVSCQSNSQSRFFAAQIFDWSAVAPPPSAGSSGSASGSATGSSDGLGLPGPISWLHDLIRGGLGQ